MTRETTKMRLERMLNEPSIEINEETKEAARREFERVAKEYFDADRVELTLKRGKSGMDVTVSFHAARVKNFNVVK